MKSFLEQAHAGLGQRGKYKRIFVNQRFSLCPNLVLLSKVLGVYSPGKIEMMTEHDPANIKHFETHSFQ